MKKKTKIIVIAISVVVALSGVGVTGYFLYQNNQNIKKIETRRQQKLAEEKRIAEFVKTGEKAKKAAEFIAALPVDLSQIKQISKFRSCEGHDYSGYFTDGVKEESRSMKHYFEPKDSLRNTRNKIKIFSPFDGVVSYIGNDYDLTPRGTRIQLEANVNNKWTFIIFHVVPESGVAEGIKVKAGQLLGYADVVNAHDFDFALAQKSNTGQGFGVFDSIFNYVNAETTSAFEARGLSKGAMITTREFRNADPCNFAGNSSKPDDWVMVK